MRVVKRIVPVVLFSVLALNGNSFALAGHDTDQGTLLDNRKQLIETNSCPGCDLSGVDLDRVNLTGANLEGANLSKVRLRLATLAKANLRNVDLRDADLGGSDLAEADLRGADLRGATFAGAYLVGAQFDDAVTLSQPSEESVSVTVPGRNIVTESALPAPSQEPGFFDKTLQSLKGVFGLGDSGGRATVIAKTENGVQEENQAQGHGTAGTMGSGDTPDPAAEAEKNRERLLETKRCYGCSLVGVDLAGKDLGGADLESADLTGSNLRGADLEKANLKGALLVRVDLRNTDLRRADLYKANLSGADLTGARLDGALLDGAQLLDVVGYKPKEE
ncbi:MAG: pentapeptide repeat-containing protein [Desulfoarculaceae bacterium]|nr:pentapeptide repeat-containing protein [Desulfoarculaceae bacterium]